MNIEHDHGDDSNLFGDGTNQDQHPPLSDLLRTLPPTNHLDELYDTLLKESADYFKPSQFLGIEKIYTYLEQRYRKSGFIGRGYHCLEHNLEVALLILKMAGFVRSGNRPAASMPLQFPVPLIRKGPGHLLEVVVAAMLHDYDPGREFNELPKIARILHAIATEPAIATQIEKMGLSINRILILVARTDYPFTQDMLTQWMCTVVTHIPEDQRVDFVHGAETLALADKASTYILLSVEKAYERVGCLADEMHVPHAELLAGTYKFIYNENVFEVLFYLPQKYWTAWETMSGYFKAIVPARI